MEKNKDNIIVDSLLSTKIFSYFTNKIEESNIIIGQQKLDAYAQIINLLKSKNKMAKIDILQKHNIQKCMYWCDKYKIPYNKLFDFNQICFPSMKIQQVRNMLNPQRMTFFHVYEYALQ